MRVELSGLIEALSRATLIAGGYKLDQLLIEPFHSFQAALVRHVHNADAILVGGYGFADVHINRALQNRWGSVTGHVPVMVLDYAGPKTDPMMFGHDLWAHGLTGTFAAPGDFFREIGRPSPPSPRELAANQAFEVSSQHKVTIWHAGFTSAADAIDRIVPWLSGEADDVLRKRAESKGEPGARWKDSSSQIACRRRFAVRTGLELCQAW